MPSVGNYISTYGLENHGIQNTNLIYWNLPTPLLYEEAIRRQEGHLAHLGPLVVHTGTHTGRSPNDKYIVRDAVALDKKVWWGRVNHPLDPHHFANLYHRLLAYLQGKDLFVQDCFAGTDPVYRLPIRIITETAWHSLFARNLFLQSTPELLPGHIPEFTLIHTPHFRGVPQLDGTRSDVFIVIHFGQKLILIGGTPYAGEIKKSIFTALNFLLPQKHVLPMHCLANVGQKNDVALFFGLSGTGKSTLATDPERQLIGDDEIGWSERGVFNLEGGCYVKVIRLSATEEPEIFASTRRFGTVLENVAIDSQTGRLLLGNDSLTENTRAAYPISHLPYTRPDRWEDHARNIVMLTADVFGVLPPIARLNENQAIYHFLSGYTTKFTGSEDEIVTPQAAFSPCFGAPFLALTPVIYAHLLGEKIAKYKVNVWLVNTGWVGGPQGTGQRIKISWTRAMVKAAINGSLEGIPMDIDPVFGVFAPIACPEIPSEILNYRGMWKDACLYETQAKKLAGMFIENFRSYENKVSPEIQQAGPKINI